MIVKLTFELNEAEHIRLPGFCGHTKGGCWILVALIFSLHLL